jgi:membrane protein DedA with SNARE-associated domain
MAWAAGFGLLAYGVYNGQSIAKSIPAIVYSIIGGTIGGLVLYYATVAA